MKFEFYLRVEEKYISLRDILCPIESGALTLYLFIYLPVVAFIGFEKSYK